MGNPFQRRVGWGDFPSRWRGVNREGAPSNIDLNELRDAINVRYFGGQITERGGQSKLTSSTVNGCVYGMHDHKTIEIGGPKLYSQGAFSPHTGNESLWSYHEEDTPVLQVISDGNYGYSANSSMIAYDGALHFVHNTTGGGLLKLERIVLLPDQDATDVAGLDRGVPVLIISGLDASCLEVMRPTLVEDERIFIGTVSGGHVYTWDGTSLRRDTSVSLGSGQQVIKAFHEDLFVFGTHYARKRAGGTYSTVTMPGALTSFLPSDAAIYKDALYVIGQDNVGGGGGTLQYTIIKYDGTSLTVARSIDVPFGVETNPYHPSLAVFNGYLYFGWEDANFSDGYIGRFDGSTWTEKHKNLEAQFGMESVTCMVEFKGSLFAGGNVFPSPEARLVSSPGTDTGGTWVNRGNFGASVNPPLDLYVF